MRLAFWSIVLLIIAVAVAGSSCFTVDRADYVYLTQFGRPVAVFDGEKNAGLHTKWPWPVQSVARFDHRLQFFDLREVELLTHDARSETIDKNLLVSAYVTWRIAGEDGVKQFVVAVGSLEGAQRILEQRINSRLGAEVSKMPVDDLIGVAPDAQVEQRVEKLRQRLLGSDGNDNLRDLARREYGIELVDVRLRRFNHPPSVRAAIFERIKSERKKKVIDYTSEGEKLAADITSEAERAKRDILTEANSEKKRLEEGAAARADAIRNEAHSKDREFYTFLQKLNAYQIMLGEGKDMLLLSSRNDLFDLLLKPPKMTAPTPEGPVARDPEKEPKKPAPKEPEAPPVGPKNEGGR
jgi:membrane protease subunit HflC